MSFNLEVSSGFSVARTNKSGKTTYRGALGVITSGNAAERGQLAQTAIDKMVDNNNFAHLAREVFRVFPVAFLKKSGRVFTNGDDVYVSSPDGATLERLVHWTEVKKPTMLAVAAVVLEACTKSTEGTDKEIKGEKLMYQTAMARVIDKHNAYLALVAQQEAEAEAAQLALEQAAA